MINFIDRTAIAKLQMAQSQINTRLDSDFGSFHLSHPPTFNSKLQLQLQYSTMETTRKELRTLTIPHGVHKPSNNCKPPSRNAAFQACQACYARKKRCVTSPSHHQCTYCFREGQRCLPRERPVRYGFCFFLTLSGRNRMLIFKSHVVLQTDTKIHE